MQFAILVPRLVLRGIFIRIVWLLALWLLWLLGLEELILKNIVVIFGIDYGGRK